MQASKPDIVFINEVERDTVGSGRHDQMQLLAAGAGYPYWVFAARGNFDGGQAGDGILSLLPLDTPDHYLPLDDPHITKLPSGTWTTGDRIILHMRATIPSVTPAGASLHLYVTRFVHGPEFSDWRLNAARTAVQLFDQAQGPIVFGGDLNAHPGTPEINLIATRLKDSFVTSPYPPPACDGTETKHCTDDDTRIDYLFYRDQSQGPFQVPWYKAWCNVVTDHPYLVVHLNRPEPNECFQLRADLTTLYAQRQALYEAKAGLNPRDPADLREIRQINAEIAVLDSQVQAKYQRAAEIKCT